MKFITIIWLMLLGSNGIASGQETTTLPDKDRLFVQNCLIGFLDGRQRLYQGEFTATEELIPADESRGVSDIYCVFDHTKGLFRFEREYESRQFRIQVPEGSSEVNSKNVEWVTKTFQGKFVRTPNKELNWSTFNPYQVDTVSPGSKSTIRAQPFFPRSVGIDSCTNHRLVWDFEKIISAFQDQSIVAVSSDSNLAEIKWVFGPDSSLTRTLRLDQSRNFIPVRMEIRPNNSNWKRPEFIYEVEWEQVNDVWVPRRNVETHYNVNGEEQSKHIFRFDWLSVNETVKESQFSADDLNLHFAIVVDKRSGSPIVTGKVGTATGGIQNRKAGAIPVK